MSTASFPVLDPAIHKRNIEALTAVGPHLVERIENAITTDNVALTWGRDGTPTYRLKARGDCWIWLGHSSMPSVSSAEILAAFNWQNDNVMLPTLGHGGEARYLLEHMSPHQALYVWDANALVPALCFRIHDFSVDLQRGRLLLAIGHDPEAAMKEVFRVYDAHIPPARIFASPSFNPEQMHHLQVGVTSASSWQSAQLANRVAHVSVPPTCDAESERCVILSMVPHTSISETANALCNAACSASRNCVLHIADRPSHVHLASAIQLLQDHKPSRVILLDQVRGEFGPLLNHVRTAVSWLVSSGALRNDLVSKMGKNDRIYASSQRIIHSLQKLGAMVLPMKLLPVAGDSSTFGFCTLGDQEQQYYGSDVAIILNGAPLRADSWGLDWEMHKKLFSQLIKSLTGQLQRLDSKKAELLLNRACQKLNIRLPSIQEKERFTLLISERLAPTISTVRLVESLVSHGLDTKLWGTGWDLDTSHIMHLKAVSPTAQERNKIYHASKVIIHMRNDVDDAQHLIDALTAGSCIIRLSGTPSTCAQPELPSDLINDIPAFTSTQEAVRLCKLLLADPEERNARFERIFEEVRRNHSMGNRLAALLQSGPDGM